MGLGMILKMKMRNRYIFWSIRLLFLLVFVRLCLYFFDYQYIAAHLMQLLQQPFWLVIMAVLYGAAFILRAYAWQKYLDDRQIRYSVYLHALFYSLFINHLSPMKIGDAVRAGILMREKKVSWDEAIHSVAVMRILDLLILGSIAGIGTLFVGLTLSWTVFIWMVGLGLGSFAVFVILGMIYWRNTGHRHKQAGGKPLASFVSFALKHFLLLKSGLAGYRGLAIVGCITASWLLEAVVVLGITSALLLPVSVWEGIWVNSMTIAGQVFHFTPGGIGTYESVMSFSLTAVGLPMKEAYTIALISHGFKFVFSYAAGACVLWKAPIPLQELGRWIKRKGEQTS